MDKDTENRTANFTDMPDRENELWAWVCALYAYDYDDPKPLSKLIRVGGYIPPEFINAIADIVDGLRKPNKKAAAKMKVPASEYMKVAASVSTILGLGDIIKYDAINPYTDAENTPTGACSISENKGKDEPKDIIMSVNKMGRQAKQDAADHFGISLETVENMIRELRHHINSWPTL